jgi:hypothetical protein
MCFKKSILLLVCLYVIFLEVESECQNNYGRKLLSSVSLRYIKSQKTPTTKTDPYPCCVLCINTSGCDNFSMDFKNGSNANCTLYGLDNSQTQKINILFGKLYEKKNYPGSCIGYTNDYLGI